MWLLRFLSALILAVMLAGSAFAQTLPAEVDIDVETLTRDVQSLVTRFQDRLDDEDAMVAIAQQAAAQQGEAIAIGVTLTERITAVRTRLDQLGAPPAEGEAPEPELVTAERNALQEERARINLLIGQLEDATITAGDLTDDIAERRRELFSETLSKRYDISQAFGEQFFSDFNDRLDRLTRRVNSWLSFTWRTKQTALIGALFVSLFAAVGAVFGSRKTFGAWIERDRAHEAPTYFARLTVGFWYTLLPTFVFWALLGVIYLIFDNFGVLRGDIAELAVPLFGGLAILYLVLRLSRAVFAPYVRNWRLINIGNRSAVILHVLMVVMATIVVADGVIARFNIILGTSLPITIGMSLLTSIAVGLVLIAMGRVRVEQSGDEPAPASWTRWVQLILLFTGVGLILLAFA
ncbi:MAG: hypothetical protein AAFP99_12160, partial [Pseudomonadota bacterium]